MTDAVKLTDSEGLLNPANNTDENQRKITCYPNPVSNYLTVDLGNYNGPFLVELMDLRGRVIRSYNSLTSIPFMDCAKGVYILKVNYGYHVQEFKIVKD